MRWPRSTSRPGTIPASPRTGCRGLLVHWGATEDEEIKGDVEDIIHEAMHGDGNGSLPVLVRAASRTASVIRERLSTDATRALDDLRAIIGSKEEEDVARREPTARFASSPLCPGSLRRT